jgi:Uma2 family endonuclease
MDLSVRDKIELDDADVYEAADEITDEEIYENAIPNSPSQFDWTLKLVALLRYMYRNETCFVIGDMPIIPPRPREGEKPYGFKYICPDVSVFKGVDIPQPYSIPFGSWRMRLANRPAPDVVIEIASHRTWSQDVKADKKPAK